MNKSFYSSFLLLLLLTACENMLSEADAGRAAERFADAFVNYDFEKAALLTTDDTKNSLRFVASNISEDDIALINGNDRATVDVEEIDVNESETEATAIVSVEGWIRKDSLWSKPKRIEQCSIQLHLVKEQAGKWLVRMEDPLQNGMRCRD